MICRSGLSIKATDNVVNEMTKETFEAKAEKAHGKLLPSPIVFQVTVEKYDGIEEVRAANDYPSDADVVDFLNAARKAAATTAARTAALEAAGIVKPTRDNDPQVRLKEMAALFKSNGMTMDAARSAASTALGIEWEE